MKDTERCILFAVQMLITGKSEKQKGIINHSQQYLQAYPDEMIKDAARNISAYILTCSIRQISADTGNIIWTDFGFRMLQLLQTALTEAWKLSRADS